jgi:hypothetical protein
MPGIRYEIYASRDEDAKEGSVWLYRPNYPSRTIMVMKRVDEGGRQWKTFCEARHIDRNFIRRYNDNEGQRTEILTRPTNVLVISEWYRNALGGFATSHQPGHEKLYAIAVRRARLPGWRALRAAAHHPDFGIRLGTRLGVLGGWLGLLGILLGLPALKDVLGILLKRLPALKDVLRILLGRLPAPLKDALGEDEKLAAFLAYLFLAGAAVVMLAAFIGWLSCRGPTPNS